MGLRSLDLSYSQTLTSVNYATLFQAAPNIRRLNLAHCPNLTQVNVQNATALQTLQVQNCPKLRTLGEHLFPTSVRYVDCFGCENLSDSDLLKVVTVAGNANWVEGGSLNSSSVLLGQSTVSAVPFRIIAAASGSGGSGVGGGVPGGNAPGGAGGGSSPREEGGSRSGGGAGVSKESVGTSRSSAHSTSVGSADEFHSVVGDLRVYLKEERGPLPKGTQCRLLDCWVSAEDGGSKWRYYLEPLPRACRYFPEAKHAGAFSHTKNVPVSVVAGLPRGAGRPFVVLASDLGVSFDFVKIEDRLFMSGERGGGGPTFSCDGVTETSYSRTSTRKSDQCSPTKFSPNEIQHRTTSSSSRRNSLARLLLPGPPGPLLVWPSCRRAAKLQLPRSFVQQAARAKLLRAVEFARLQFHLEEHACGRDEALTERHSDDAKVELLESVRLAEEAGVSDLVLFKAAQPHLVRWFEDTEFKDVFSQQGKVKARDMVASETSSEFLREVFFDFLPSKKGLVITQLGDRKARGPLILPLLKGVRYRDRNVFQQTALDLQTALNTWDCAKLKAAITRACGPGNPRFVLKEDKTEATVLPTLPLRECERYYRKVEAVLAFWAVQLQQLFWRKPRPGSSSGGDRGAVVREGNGGAGGGAEGEEEEEEPVLPPILLCADAGTSTSPAQPTADAPSTGIVLNSLSYKQFVRFNTTDCSISVANGAFSFVPRQFPGRATAALAHQELAERLLLFLKRTFLEKLYLPYCLELKIYCESGREQDWTRQLAMNRARLLLKILCCVTQSAAELPEEVWGRVLSAEGKVVGERRQEGLVLRRVWSEAGGMR